MTTRLNPYLSFQDTARAAGEFYHSVFGGELTVSTFSEFGMSQDPADADKVMHSQLVSPNGLVLMMADTPQGMPYNPGDNVSVSLSGEDEAELRGFFDKLSEGGTLGVPMEKAPWGDYFGMFVDKFGINWLVNAAGTPAAE